MEKALIQNIAALLINRKDKKEKCGTVGFYLQLFDGSSRSYLSSNDLNLYL